jgi:hypothetical protein
MQSLPRHLLLLIVLVLLSASGTYANARTLNQYGGGKRRALRQYGRR